MHLEKEEVILYEGEPSPDVVKVWIFTKIFRILFISAFFILWATLFFGGIISCVILKHKEPPFILLPFFFGIGLPLIFVFVYLYYKSLYKTYRYYITNKRCIFEGGILVKRKRSAPFYKITDIEVSQFILERILGLHSLKIFTPGTASSGSYGFQRAEIVFEGLKDVETPYRLIQEQIDKSRKGLDE